MRKLIFGLFLLCSFVFFAEMATAQALKIGVVDSEKIVLDLPEAQQADQALKDLSKKYQDSLMGMQKALEEKYAGYQQQSSMMSDQAKAAAEQELTTMNQELQMFNQEKFGQQGEIFVKRMEYLEPIRKKVLDAIEKVAKQEKISLVLEKNSGNVLYADNKFDITYKVLDLLKRS